MDRFGRTKQWRLSPSVGMKTQACAEQVCAKKVSLTQSSPTGSALNRLSSHLKMSATVAVVLMMIQQDRNILFKPKGIITMTIFINEAKDLATSITTKESEIASFRNSLDIESDRIGLITVLAVEAYKRNILINRKGRKKDAGEYLEVVCFEVCGQKGKSGKGKKLAENAQKLAQHSDFKEIIQNCVEATNKAVQNNAETTDIVREAKFAVTEVCENEGINSYNKLVAYLNPKEPVSDVDQLIALATKLVKASGEDVQTIRGEVAIHKLLSDATEKAVVYYDGKKVTDNVTPIKKVA